MWRVKKKSDVCELCEAISFQKTNGTFSIFLIFVFPTDWLIQKSSFLKLSNYCWLFFSYFWIYFYDVLVCGGRFSKNLKLRKWVLTRKIKLSEWKIQKILLGKTAVYNKKKRVWLLGLRNLKELKLLCY